MKFSEIPKTWLIWTALVVGLILGGLLSGCATTTAYKGPDYSTPIVHMKEWTHWNTSSDPRHPYWERHRFVVFENPLYRNVSFDVDCENATFHVDVPGRSVKELLITREDGACNIRRVPDRTL
jgi:hypothetical protein